MKDHKIHIARRIWFSVGCILLLAALACSAWRWFLPKLHDEHDESTELGQLPEEISDKLQVNGKDTFEYLPEWLTGKLYVSCGLKSYYPSDPEMADAYGITQDTCQYVCVCDFSNNHVKIIEVPNTAVLHRDLQEDTLPVILEPSFERHTSGYNGTGKYAGTPMISTGAFSSIARQKYQVYSLKDDLLFAFYDGSEDLLYVDGWEIYDSWRETTFSLDCCFSILGFDGDQWDDTQDEYAKYYLKYAVSDDGKLEIQMVHYLGATETVYHHFPVEYEWDYWKYAISNDGKIAWVDPSSQRLYISDGKTEIALPENLTTVYSFGWSNDSTLLFLNNNSQEHPNVLKPYSLMAFHTDTGVYEEVRTQEGAAITLDNMLMDVAIDPDGKYLACYYTYFLYCNGEPSWDRYDGILILSLETGERYLLNPEEFPYFDDIELSYFWKSRNFVPHLVWTR